MWLMRTPSPSSYIDSLSNNVDLKSAYARDAASYGSHTFIADGDLDIEVTTMSSHEGVCDYLIHFASTSVFSELDHDEFQDFDDSDSETDFDSDSDSEAQYITIPPGSPWWKAPPSSHSVSFDTVVDEDNFNEDDVPSSHSFSEVLQQQQFLVGVFHDELRRAIPGDHHRDDDWLQEVDAKLLLAPAESCEDGCKGSIVPASQPLSTDFVPKPLPDVPVDFDDVDDDSDDSTDGWEPGYHSHIHRINFVEVRPLADSHFIRHQVH